MKRRDFVRDLALGSAGLLYGPSLLAQATPLPGMSMITGESPAAITK
jgi:hypothetical protein